MFEGAVGNSPAALLRPAVKIALGRGPTRLYTSNRKEGVPFNERAQ